MDRGDESPTAARSEPEELQGLDMEQDADPNDNPGHEDEADSGDEDGIEPIDMQHMVIHDHRTEHSGALHMYNTGRLASQIVKMAFVVPRPRRIDAEDVFESLTKFEEERKSGKRKTTTPRSGNNKKKPRPVEAQFKSIVSQTMGRKSYKEVIPLVCCSDETYAAFEQFVKP
ncbi:hypothetical protein R1sor_004194 [Riccia sorocarpa]|uniref:Uncharacterized protein n=1 Tax=Riccia sorocarpa TaxID=122646 RepID=A0ABD3H6L7_9MARC